LVEAKKSSNEVHKKITIGLYVAGTLSSNLDKYYKIAEISDNYPPLAGKRQDKVRDKIRDFMNNVANTTVRFIPLSFLFFSEKDAVRNVYNVEKEHGLVHIEFGYTYKDSRVGGFSSMLRDLLQLYAYDNNKPIVSTLAVTWGSQLASKKCGWHCMPELPGTRKLNKTLIPAQAKRKIALSRAKIQQKTQSNKNRKKTWGTLAHKMMQSHKANEEILKTCCKAPQSRVSFLNLHGSGAVQKTLYSNTMNNAGAEHFKASALRRITQKKAENILKKYNKPKPK